MHRRAVRLLAAAPAAVLCLAFTGPRATGARTWDLITYTAPPGFTVDESAHDHVLLSHIEKQRYCLIGIYNSTDAQADLDASFANEWQNVVAHQVSPAPLPTPSPAVVGGAQARAGMVMGAIHH